jgi:type II secretory pathway component GspD/PulD (secretin)
MAMMHMGRLIGCLALMPVVAAAALGQSTLASVPPVKADAVSEQGDSVSVRFVDVDLRAAVAALAPYLDRPVVFGAVPASRVTIETPHPVSRGDVARFLGGIVAAQNLELAVDTAAGIYRVRAREAPPAAPPAGGGVGGHPGSGPNGSAVSSPELFVIHLSHARAADVAATVNSLYGRASALGELGKLPASGGTLASALAQNQLQLATASSGATPAANGAHAAVFTGETTIVPDPGTNSLLIRANAGDFELISSAVKELDVRPLQVLIQVMIAEVSTNAAWSFGVTTTFPNQTVKGTSTQVGGSIAGLGSGDFALNIMKAGGLAINAQLNLAASKGEARILSRPVVLAQNNQEAEILLGSQQPFIQVSQTQVGAVAQNQVVQYQDVGTKLSVTPTISADGYIQLDVTQEVSEATGQVSFNAPVISTRSVKTRLMARDTQTVVLGGLSSIEKDRNSEGIPILSSLPLIGGLFGQTSRTTTGTEFFVFLTPRILRTDDDASRATEPLDDAMLRELPK